MHQDPPAVSRALIERYFRAMQLGADAEDELVALFAEDAVYAEPFGGGVHEGRAAIREWLNGSRVDAPADLRLTVESIEAAGDEVVTHWTCVAPAFAEPARGRDRFTIRDGRIARLESTLVHDPRLSAADRIRRCRDHERGAILEIVNAAAEAYRGVIPADRWHEPYMPADDLDREIAAGVRFWGCESGGALVGVMGIQSVRDVQLIRHAYVRPEHQGRGVGGALLEHLARASERRMLVGTWAAAAWSIRFYRRHGFAAVPSERTAALLRRYWTIPDRQVETSVVLARPPLGAR